MAKRMTKLQVAERKDELARFSAATREAQGGIGSMGIYFPSGKLGKDELVGFEAVFKSMRATLDMIERSVLPRKK